MKISVLLTPRIVAIGEEFRSRFSGLVALVSQRLWRHSAATFGCGLGRAVSLRLSG